MNAIKILSLVLAGAIVLSGAAVVWPLLTDDRVTVAFSEKPDYETLIVANEQGMLEDAGIKPYVVTGGIMAAEALLTGSADMAAMGDGPAVRTIVQNDDVAIVARFIGGEGMHRFLAFTDITEPKDLEGKRVALQQGSSTHGAFLRWMQANGVEGELVEIVPMVPSDIPLAMESGINGERQIDAMAGSEPWAVNTETRCGDEIHEIGDSSGQGSTFPIVLLATQRVIDRNPEAVSAMIEVLERGTRFIQDNWTEAMEICAERTGVASVEDQEACSGSLFFDVGFNDTDVHSLMMAAQVLVDFGRIDSVPDVESRVDLRFITEGGG